MMFKDIRIADKRVGGKDDPIVVLFQVFMPVPSLYLYLFVEVFLSLEYRSSTKKYLHQGEYNCGFIIIPIVVGQTPAKQ